MSDMDDMRPDNGNGEKLDAGRVQSQWEIVERQFAKRRTAVWGLRATLMLVLASMYAPLIASSIPFVWKEKGKSIEFPWFRTLFEQNYWESGVDRFFNMLMVSFTLYLFVALIFCLTGARAAWRNRRGLVRRIFIVATVIMALVQASGFLLTKAKIVDYRAIGNAAAEGEEPLYIPPLIPYTHRDQLPDLKDKFIEGFEIAGGEVHLLGTDQVGRDTFSRMLYGTRISLIIGVIAVAIYCIMGTVLGAIAGYFGGWVDLVIMRLVEVMICVPALFLLLTIIALFSAGTEGAGIDKILLIMIAIGLVSWTGVARLVRGEFIRERGLDYVIAAKSLGFKAPRIVFRHILPNAIQPVIVAASFGIPAAILTESGLSFLGLGDFSVPSWGRTLNEGRENSYWHLIIPPSVAIFFTVTVLNMVGDGIRDALDPRLRK